MHLSQSHTHQVSVFVITILLKKVVTFLSIYQQLITYRFRSFRHQQLSWGCLSSAMQKLD